jgi:hypothetical protein
MLIQSPVIPPVIPPPPVEVRPPVEVGGVGMVEVGGVVRVKWLVVGVVVGR